MRGKRVLLLAMMAVAGCGGGAADTVVTADYQELPADRVAYGTRSNITVDGVRRAVQEADSMYLYEDSTVAQMFGVHLLMYDSLGSKIADLRSKRGRFDQRSQKMVAQGKVVLVRSDRTRIETEELNYDPEAKRIWSDRFTRVTMPDGSVTTYDTFTADSEFKNMTGQGMRGKVPGLKL